MLGLCASSMTPSCAPPALGTGGEGLTRTCMLPAALIEPSARGGVGLDAQDAVVVGLFLLCAAGPRPCRPRGGVIVRSPNESSRWHAAVEESCVLTNTSTWHRRESHVRTSKSHARTLGDVPSDDGRGAKKAFAIEVPPMSRSIANRKNAFFVSVLGIVDVVDASVDIAANLVAVVVGR